MPDDAACHDGRSGPVPGFDAALLKTVWQIPGRFNDFLENITASGNSSWKWLQNCFTTSNSEEQGITVALALTELFIAKKQKGACRVHGGGFAGVIMAMLPNEIVEEYKEYMESCLGEGCVYKMSIRPYGAICVSEYL